MLQQILTRTPLFVWAILALLIVRGLIAAKDRHMAFGKLLILPLLMPLFTLQDLAAKFGLGGMTLSLWAGAVALATALAWKLGRDRISAGTQPGKVLVRGSWMPLTVLMAIFFTKYAVTVMLAIAPLARHDARFAAIICILFGVFNGLFFGRLVRDAGNYQPLRAQDQAWVGGAM